MQEIRRQFEKLTASMYEGDFTQYSPDGDYVDEVQQTNFDMYKYGYMAGRRVNWLPIEELSEGVEVLGYWEHEETKGYSSGYEVIEKCNGEIHGSECTYHKNLFVKFQFITPPERTE